MSTTELNSLKSVVEELMASLTDIRSRTTDICDTIDAEELIPAKAVTELEQVLDIYRSRELQLRDLGERLSLDFGTKLCDITATIQAYEDKTSVETYREIVLAYFRLNSQAAEVKTALERTKLALIEKCVSVSAGEYANALEPYALVVSSVKDREFKPEKDSYLRISREVGDDIAYYAIVDRGQIYYDPDIDISLYSNTASPLLPQPIETSEVDDFTSVEIQASEIEPEPECIKTSEVFDSYIDHEDFRTAIIDLEYPKFTLADIKSLDKKNPDTLPALWLLAHIKLINRAFINMSWPHTISKDALELLENAGFIGEIVIPAHRGKKEVSFITLTTAGWGCFKDDAIRFYLSKHQPPLVIPNSLQIMDFSMWSDPHLAHRAACLSDYCIMRDLNFIMYMQENIAGEFPYPVVRTTGNDGALIVPALFRQGTEDYVSELVHVLNSVDENSNVTLLVQNPDDMAPLADKLEGAITREIVVAFTSFNRNDAGEYPSIVHSYGHSETEETEAAEADTIDSSVMAAESPWTEEHIADATSPQEDPVVVVKAVNDVKTSAPSAKKFKAEMRDLFLSQPIVALVFPLLTNIGACTIEQMERLEKVFRVDQKDAPSNVWKIMNYLADKGHIAHYRIDSPEGEKNLYGLSGYTYGCLRKEDIQNARSLWFVSVGNRLVGNGHQATVKELMTTYSANEALVEYLETADEIYSKAEIRAIHSSMKWREDHYEIACIDTSTGKKISCGLLHDGINPANMGALPMLISQESNHTVSTNDGYPIIGNGTDHYYMFCKDEYTASICRWDKGDNVGSSIAYEDLTDINDIEPCEITSLDELYEEREDAPSADSAPALDMARSGAETDPAEDESDEESELALDTITEPSAFGITADMSHVETAAVILEGSISPRYFLVYQDLIHKLAVYTPDTTTPDTVVSGMAQALLLARSLVPFHSGYQRLCEQLATALDSDIAEHHYTNKRLSALYSEDTQGSILHLLSIMRALFSPEEAYDNNLLTYAKAYFDAFDSYFEPYYELKPFYKTLLDLMSVTKTGLSANVRRNFIDNEKHKAQVSSICAVAEALCTEFPKITQNINGIPQMLRNCFAENSDLGVCMKIIADNDTSQKDFVELLLSDFCESGTYDVEEYKVSEYIDKKWRETTANIKTTKKIFHEVRLRFAAAIERRLNTMKDWLEAVGNTNLDKSLLDKAGKYHSQVCKHLASLKSPTGVEAHEAALICHAFTNMENILRGEQRLDFTIFGDTLRTGYFCIDNASHLPVMFDELPIVPHYEPWTNVLRHILTPERSFADTLELIRRGEEPEYRDNIGQAMDICVYCDNVYDSSGFVADIDSAKKTARHSIEKFNGELELAFAYNRIDEKTKEGIAEIILQYQPVLEDNANFGALHIFLDALRQHVAEMSAKKRETLERSVARLRSRELTPEMEQALDAIQAKISGEEQNFVVAEEYINLFDAGIFDGAILAAVNNTSHFLQFIDPEVFDKLLRVCEMNKSRAIRDFGAEYVEKEFHRKGIASQYQRSAKALLSSMPPRSNETKEEADPERIRTLMKELGFNATGSVRKNPSGNMLHYVVSVDPDEKGRSEYIHPIAEMGTKIKPQLDVIFLFGQKQPNDIVDTICNMELNEHSIVFLNGALDLASRRQLAERFHREKSGRNPFLLIDWVLLLHLASFPQSERMSIMLNCTMPYTSSFNPFVTTSAIPLPDEMYIGRKDELSQITDPHGPVFVYGGRQLGKTALLEKAARLKNKPEKKEYGIKVQMGGVSEEFVAVERICDELTRAGVKINPCVTVRGLCKELMNGYDKGDWQQLFIFIDEADAILAAFKQQVPTYDAIVALSELMKSTNGNFKFVMAGLHDVCRAANDPNTVFGQFGKPLVIRPLDPHDALELLCKPLRYLGFKLDLEELEVMLLNTSFYPGIIHFVGYNLVQNLSTKYGEYYQANKGNPPYELSKRQLGDIMNANAINTEINNRICWTLDVDKRYLAIARCIAYLYHDQPHNNHAGHSADTIREYADIFEIPCLMGLTKAEFDTLLHELVEMRILIQPSGNTYRLRQRRFLDAIGNTPEKIEADIAEGNRHEV